MTLLLQCIPGSDSYPSHWRGRQTQTNILHLAASAPSPTDDTLPFLHVRIFYNFRIQNLFLYFCSRLDLFVALKQLAVLLLTRANIKDLKHLPFSSRILSQTIYQTNIDRDNRWCSGKYKRARSIFFAVKNFASRENFA